MTGLRMCSWADDAIKFYMIGNPMTWVCSFVSILLVAALSAVYAIRQRRQINDFNAEQLDTITFAAKLGFGGWFLHYMPFWIMGRVT
jgi:dolichyl-phosphate-mannose-protein mannosyltransferase